MTSARHFDVELDGLKEQLLSMAGYVERAIEYSAEGLQRAEKSQFLSLYSVEKQVNQSHMLVDDRCVKLLALQQPLAADLRLIVAILKINTDLERMADHAVNIGHNAEHYIRKEPLKPLVDLPQMFSEVRIMVREAIDSFVKRDAFIARKVLTREDRVDAYKHKIMKDVLEHLKTKPDAIEAGLCLILIARNLERIGDHATNIAEDVIYAITGDDIRHSPKMETMREILEGADHERAKRED